MIIVILIYLITGLIEVTALIKKGKSKELILFSAVFITSFVISFLLSIHVKIPSPTKPVKQIISAVFGLES